MNAVFGVLDWIAVHVFRGRVQWPCWLLDWAWSRQAAELPTPVGMSARTSNASADLLEG